jgi:hypothetical protein
MNGHETAGNWSYMGSGLWHGTCGLPGTFRYNGREVLFDWGGAYMVFVKADNEAAVAEHLKEREGY